jgi:hypothetical protein
LKDAPSLPPGVPPRAISQSRSPTFERDAPGRSRSLAIRRATAFVIAAALPAYLAARGAGYDLVVRQEFGLVLWAAIGGAIALGVLPRTRLTWLLASPLIAGGALALLSLLSLSWTGSSEHTFAEVARVLIYVGVVALAVLGLNRYTWRAAALGLGAAAIGICVLAIVSRLAPGAFDDPVRAFFDTDRLSYPLNYWNAVAAWGAMTIAMGLAWSANSRQRAIRAVGLGAVPVAGLAVYLTYSRGGVVSTAVAAVTVLALSRSRWTAALHAGVAGIATGIVILVARGQPAIADATSGAGGVTVALALVTAIAACAVVAVVTRVAGIDHVRLSSRLARIIVPVGLLVAVVAVAAGGHSLISRGWREFENQRTVSVGTDPAERLTSVGGTRHDVWAAALDAFDAHPLGGTGSGTFEFWWATHGSGHEFVRDAHSLYLEEMAELGLPGLLVLLAFLGTTLGLAVRGRVRARRSSEVAAAVAMCSAAIVFLVQAGVDWMWEETAVGVLGLGAMAIGAAALNDRRRRGGAWLGARGMLVGLALVAALLEVPGLVSGSREGQSEAALRAGDVAQARTLAGQAVSAEPWAATPYEQRAATEVRANDPRGARADLEHAISNEPADWRQHLQLSQVELELDHAAAAHRQFDQARRLNTVTLPYQRFEELRRAVAPRCLVLGPVDCGGGGTFISKASCLTAPAALAASLSATGPAEVRALTMVKSVANGVRIYYLAARVSGRVALWAADPAALSSGGGTVIPLNGAARDTSARGAALDPEAFGVSPTDVDALSARACVVGR